MQKFYNKQEELTQASNLQQEKDQMARNRENLEQQRISKEIEQKRDLKQATDNALLMSQVKATLAVFLTTMDTRYNPQPQLKRSRSPMTPPDRPAPSVRSPP
mmetsp:Transcript_2371/g.5056  ORF Transcript_2371/g.5056 Transcript_2371/m.5056 type:complete len:102 (-) Transcript_2371:198-503(-)